MINSQRMKTDWLQFKAHVKKHWGKLTDNDLLVIDGETERLVAKISERYAISEEQALIKWHKFLNRYDDAGNEIKSVSQDIFDMAEHLADQSVSVVKRCQDLVKQRPLVMMSVVLVVGVFIGMVL